MPPPEIFSPDAIADLLARLGHATDRRNVVLALQSDPIEGVRPSPRRGVPWAIPRARLVEVFGILLRRRAMRTAAMHGLRLRPLAAYCAEAAERMLEDPDFAGLVSPDWRRGPRERGCTGRCARH